MKSYGVIIQMKATEQYFPVVLFIILYKVVLWMKSYGMTIQMKASEQYFPVVLFIMLYKVVLTLESVDEIFSMATNFSSGLSFASTFASTLGSLTIPLERGRLNNEVFNFLLLVTVPLSLHTTRCLSFPNTKANKSTSASDRGEATFVPKEAMIKPCPPELLINSSKSGGIALASWTLSGPTIT